MDKRLEATGFFSVIKRQSELDSDSSNCRNTSVSSTLPHDLYVVPYSQEYETFLVKAAELLRKAGDMTDTPRYIFLSTFSFKLLDFWKFTSSEIILSVV